MYLRCVGVLLLVMLLAASASGNSGRKFYRWTDSQGKTHFSDQLPLEAIRKGHRVVDERGMTVEVREPPKTAEERAREKAEAAARERQARKDRELLMTYSSERQLLEVRDKRLESADLIISINAKQLAELEDQLAEVEQQIAKLNKAGRKPSQRLLEQQEALAERVKNKRDYLGQRRRERQEIVEQFKADLKRFRELQGGG